jgi:uncharacterized protein (DUF305 family)
MKAKTLLIATVAGAGVIGLLAVAQMTATRQGTMPGMNHPAMAAEDDSASAKAYQQAMDVMMKDMMMPYAGNADEVFARSMIPHHQGAIDMAKVFLQYGKDPEIRKMAEEVIKAQESEVAFLKDWLQRNPK